MFASRLPLDDLQPLSQPPPVKKRPALPATPASRGFSRMFFRLPDHKSDPGDSKVPQHPHLSWVHERHLLFGLQANALPNAVDLETPRVGRFFSYTAHEETSENSFVPVSIPLAMFPVSPSITFVPPYPGLPSCQSNIPNAAAACYIDGSRGAFDERRYPQLYNPRRPWIVFHDLLPSLTWNPAYCEFFNPTKYFMWNQPGNPSAGGRFVLSRLDALFSKREEVESEFAARVGQLNPATDIFSDVESARALFDMPFYDPLDWADVIKWSTWGEGREALSNTLQYVSEVKTLNRWLALIANVGPQPHTGEIPPPSSQYMGTWAPTISRSEDWQWLLRYSVPIYIITRIPKARVPANLLPGNPDGDERYRMNAFDADHSFDLYWLIRHSRSPVEVPNTLLECRANYIPSSLHPVRAPNLPPNAKSNSSLLTWLSPIYRDPHIQRFDMRRLDSQANQAKERIMLDTLFPFCPPHYRVLKADTDRHPLLDVLGSQSAKDNRITRYEEVYDDELDCYYPRRLGRKTNATKSLLETVAYRWIFPDQKVEILSDHPFPGRKPSFGRICDADDDFDELEEPSLEARRYYHADLSTNKPIKYAFTWEPYENPADVPQQPAQCCNRHRPSRNEPSAPDSTSLFQSSDHYAQVFDDPVHDACQEHRRLRANPGAGVFDRQPSLATFSRYENELEKMEKRQAKELESFHWRGRYVVLMEKAHGELRDRSDAELQDMATEIASSAETLRTQRELLESYNRRKLFKAARGDSNLSPEAIAWHIAGGDSQSICYPVRISGLHGDVTSDHVFSVLHRLLHIHYHQVVIFSSYWEVDTTRTVEFGMRFCEDALYIRALLHGVKADGRFLDVQFLSSMSGKVHAVKCPPEITEDEKRQPLDRLARIVALLATPGLTAELTTDAYRLERNLTTFVLQTRIASDSEVWELKSTERSPLQRVLTKIEDMEEWAPPSKPILIAQTVAFDPPNGPPVVTTDFRHGSMTGGMEWTESLKKAGRHTGARGKNARSNDIKHRAHPEEYAESSMSSEQRRQLVRAINSRAEFLTQCWRLNFNLPELSIGFDTHRDEKGMIKVYKTLWDWQDECLQRMRDFCEEHPTADYDFSSFENAFGGLARLEALRGHFYTAVAKALQEQSRIPASSA